MHTELNKGSVYEYFEKTISEEDKKDYTLVVFHLKHDLEKCGYTERARDALRKNANTKFLTYYVGALLKPEYLKMLKKEIKDNKMQYIRVTGKKFFLDNWISFVIDINKNEIESIEYY